MSSENKIPEAEGFSAESYSIASAQVILISGPSGSGKSAVAQRLGSLFGYSVIELDRFFLDRDAIGTELLPDGTRSIQWESPASIDLVYAVQFLREIVQAGSAMLPIYSYEQNRRIGTEPISISKRMFIFEGLHSFYFSGLLRELGLRTFKIFVDTDLEKRNEVIKKRDFTDRGKTEDFDERLRILRFGEMKWIYPYRGEADLVIFRNID